MKLKSTLKIFQCESKNAMIRTRSRRSAPLCLILIGAALVFATVHAKLFDTQLDRATVADKISLEKLQRYDLFDTQLHGGAQMAAAWYQDNAEPGYSCIHEERLGPSGEGGKWMCNPQQFRDSSRTAPCLIYSVGSNNDFQFEQAILKDVSSRCEIHVFDHTVQTPTNKPGAVHFHLWGLSNVDSADGKMKTLHSMVAALGHQGRTLDVFKVDCEGCEWTTFQSWFDAGVQIDEILVEVHGGTMTPSSNPQAKQFFQEMFNRGMLIFHKEPNVKHSHGANLCVEFGLKRVSFPLPAAPAQPPPTEIPSMIWFRPGYHVPALTSTPDDVIAESPLASWTDLNHEHPRVVMDGSDTVSYNVPQKIHFVVRDKNKISYLDSWIRHYTSWSIYVWTDTEIDEYVISKQKKFIMLLDLKGAKKSDFFRILILFDMGGIYVDSDVESLQSMEPYLRKHASSCYFTEEPDLHKIALYDANVRDILPINFFLAAEPGSPPFGLFLDALVNQAKNKQFMLSNDATFVTGPGMMRRNLDILIRCHIAPSLMFTPLVDWSNPRLQDFCRQPSDDDAKRICKQSSQNLQFDSIYTLHYWEHSWVKDPW
jgi:hypothetical protein